MVKGQVWHRKREYNQRFKVGKFDTWREIKRAKSSPSAQIYTGERVSAQNDFFYSVWKEIQQPDLSRFLNTSHSAPRREIFQVHEVLDQLKSLSSGSAGPDELSPRLLKSSRLEIAMAATKLFNRCIAESIMPQQWRDANITPVGKVRNPQNCEDFRPIAITSALCKVFERILAKRIIASSQSIWLKNKQFGFLPSRCTMDAVIQVIEDWSHAKDQKTAVFSFFFDFSKAFDLVDHEVLLEKLIKLKLEPWLISWLAAYLTGRRQCVKCGNITSEWADVEAGVIQGSVLGPILFILFISDINEFIPAGVEIEKYADDILAYITFKSASDLGTIPQQIADGVEKWCAINKMRLNPSKCKVLLVNPSSQPDTALSLSLSLPTLSGLPVEVVSS